MTIKRHFPTYVIRVPETFRQIFSYFEIKTMYNAILITIPGYTKRYSLL